MRLGGEVENAIEGVLDEEALDQVAVADVPPDEHQPRPAVDALEVREVTGVGERIQDDEALDALTPKNVTHERTADETGAPGQEDATRTKGGHRANDMRTDLRSQPRCYKSSMTFARDTWLIQLRAEQAAAEVLSLFAAKGIDAIPVKGIVTSRTLYADVADRVLTDVDLRVRPGDFRRVQEVVADAGFPLLQQMHTYRNIVFSVRGVAVDVESNPTVPGLCLLSVDQMVLRAKPSRLFGVPHLLPDTYDHAVVLMLNVFKDKFVHAFKWAVRDVELLPKTLDATLLVQRLAEVKALSIGAIVAEWMVRARAAEAWKSLRDTLVARAPRLHYARIHRWLIDHVDHDANVLRLHTRLGADSAWLRTKSLVIAGVWSAEAFVSQWRDAGFVRQVLPDDVLVPRQRSEPPIANA